MDRNVGLWIDHKQAYAIWYDDGKVEVEITSAREQEIALVLPSGIREIMADGVAIADGTSANERKITLPAGRKVSVKIMLQ